MGLKISSFDMMEDIIKELNSNQDSNTTHLIYFFSGYREYILNGDEYENPYSMGSARYNSFSKGVVLAKKDINISKENIYYEVP